MYLVTSKRSGLRPRVLRLQSLQLGHLKHCADYVMLPCALPQIPDQSIMPRSNPPSRMCPAPYSPGTDDATDLNTQSVTVTANVHSE